MPSWQLPWARVNLPQSQVFNQQLTLNACTYEKNGLSWNLVGNRHTQNRDSSCKIELVMSNDKIRKCMWLTIFPSLQLSEKTQTHKTKPNQGNIKTVMKTIPSWSTELDPATTSLLPLRWWESMLFILRNLLLQDDPQNAKSLMYFILFYSFFFFYLLIVWYTLQC